MEKKRYRLHRTFFPNRSFFQLPRHKLYMKEISKKTRNKFNEALFNKVTIQDFEKWVYKSKELEADLPAGMYMDLLTLNYKSKFVYHELEKIIDTFFDWKRLDGDRIREILKSIIVRDENCAESIQLTYELYWIGCAFLEKLGISYGLMIACPPFNNHDSTWHELNLEQQQEILDKLYPDIIQDTKNVLCWLESGKIIVKAAAYGDGYHYTYDDFRNQEERTEGEYPYQDRQTAESESHIAKNEQIHIPLTISPSFWEMMRHWWFNRADL